MLPASTCENIAFTQMLLIEYVLMVRSSMGPRCLISQTMRVIVLNCAEVQMNITSPSPDGAGMCFSTTATFAECISRNFNTLASVLESILISGLGRGGFSVKSNNIICVILRSSRIRQSVP